MPATVQCAKLRQELPAIDPTTSAGVMASKMCLMIGGPELRTKVFAQVSQKAWDMWKDHMVMIFNEYRLDPSAPESNAILKQHLDAFFFGQEAAIPNWTPDERGGSGAAGHNF